MATSGDSNGPDSIPQRRSGDALPSRGRMLPPVGRPPTDSHLHSSLPDGARTVFAAAPLDVRDQSPPAPNAAQLSPNGRLTRTSLGSQRSRTDSAGASPTSTRSSVGSPAGGSPVRPRAPVASATPASSSSRIPRSAPATSGDPSQSRSQESAVARRPGQTASSSTSLTSRSAAGSTSLQASSRIRASSATSSGRASSSPLRSSPSSQTGSRTSTLSSAHSPANRQSPSPSAIRTGSSPSLAAGKSRSPSMAEKGETRGTTSARAGLGSRPPSPGGTAGVRSSTGTEDSGKGKMAAKGISIKTSGKAPVEPDQIAAPAFDKVNALQEENEDLRRKLIDLEATQAAMADNPAALEHWKLHLLRTQNSQLENQLLATTATLEQVTESKSQLASTLSHFQQMVNRLRTAEQLQEPKADSVSRTPRSASTASSLRRTLSASTSISQAPPASARRQALPARSFPPTSTTSTLTTSTRSTGSTRPLSTSPRNTSTSSRTGAPANTRQESLAARTTPASPRAAAAGPGRSPTVSKTPASIRSPSPGTLSTSGQRRESTPSEPPATSETPAPVRLAVPLEWVEDMDQWAHGVLEKIARSSNELAESSIKGELPTATASPTAAKKSRFRVIVLPLVDNPVLPRITEDADAKDLVTVDTNNSSRQEHPILDLVRLRILEAQLGGLHPRLLRAAELLHSLLLPCLPTETIEGVEQELSNVDAALQEAAETLSHVSVFVPLLATWGGQDSLVSSQLRAALAQAVSTSYDDRRGNESGLEGPDIAGQVKDGKSLKMGKGDELAPLEDIIKSLMKIKDTVEAGSREKEVNEQLETTIQQTRRLDFVWRSEKRAQEEEIAFYRGCHAVNAAHVERVTRVAQSALENALGNATKVIAVAAAAIQQVLIAMHQSQTMSSDEADVQVLKQLQSAAPSLRRFVEVLPETLKTLSAGGEGDGEGGGEGTPSIVKQAAGKVMSALEREYKDRLQVIFESLQTKRGEAYRLRSISIPPSRSSVSPSSIVTSSEAFNGV